MATKIAIGGPINSGKSFGRRGIPDGENVIILAPSLKQSHMRSSTGAYMGAFDVKFPTGSYLADVMKKNNYRSLVNFASAMLVMKEPPALEVVGNTIWVENLTELPVFFNFVLKCLPNVHTIIQPDFTHYISNIIASKDFIQQRAGGAAFEKFWQMAADAINSFEIAVDRLPAKLVVVSEFHTEYDKELDRYEMFYPAGHMLKEKFRPESYYDIFLHTHLVTNESTGEVIDYQFCTRKTLQYPLAKSMGIFEDLYIPNDWEDVIQKVRDHVSRQ